MKFVLVGGTGSNGKAIAKEILERGYSYSNISRNPQKSKVILPEAVSHSDFSAKNREELLGIFSEADAVINLAGTSIAGGKWTDSYKNEIYNSRIETTKQITEVLNQFPEKEKVLVSTSAIGIYGNRGDELLEENSSLADDFLARVCKDWEKASQKVHSNVRVVNPRVGVVLEKSAGALAKMITPFKFFIGGPIGSGKQWFSWIHIDDLARIYVEMAENPRYEGVYNVVAPNPVRMKEFAKTLGKVMRRPSIFPVPEFALRLLLGESAAMVTGSQRVSSRKLSDNSYGFNFTYLEESLRDFNI